MFKKTKGNRKPPYKIFQWDISHNCNYSCPYCSVGMNKNKEEKYSKNWKDVISFFNNINDKKSIIRLFGGEPTLHPDFLNICNLFKCNFSIYTNLSKSYDFFNNIYKKYINLKCMYISLHYHALKNNIDDFTKKIKIFKNIPVDINIMLEDNYLNEIEEIYKNYKKIFKDKRVAIKVIDNYEYKNDISRFIKYNENWQYIEADNKIIDRYYIVKNKLNNNSFFTVKKELLCDINKYFNTVDIDGNIYNCFDKTNKIIDVYQPIENYNILNKKIICKNKRCFPYLLEYGIKQKI